MEDVTDEMAAVTVLDGLIADAALATPPCADTTAVDVATASLDVTSDVPLKMNEILQCDTRAFEIEYVQGPRWQELCCWLLWKSRTLQSQTPRQKQMSFPLVILATSERGCPVRVLTITLIALPAWLDPGSCCMAGRAPVVEPAVALDPVVDPAKLSDGSVVDDASFALVVVVVSDVSLLDDECKLGEKLMVQFLSCMRKV